MKATEIPKTDSIKALAQFWDEHDLTDFEDQLEEVTEPIFQREIELRLRLEVPEFEAVDEMARKKGIKSTDLVKQWIHERIAL
ncbi:MAG: hypothetical protein HYV26_10060 [Candidatus Hydrogenedentes bacterium]|nr:hypothetical protein [Candidatus Hydrogenedentota bacterium]